jgi:hypothetical protein
VAAAGAILIVLVVVLAFGGDKPEPSLAGGGTTAPPSGRAAPPRGGGASAKPPDTRREEEEARRLAALKADIAALEQSVRAELEAKKLKAAIDRIEAARSQRADVEWGMAADRLAKEVRDAADGAFLRLKSKALDDQAMGNATAVKQARDEVAAWGIAKYTEDLEKAFRELAMERINAGLEAWWKLDESSGTTVADASGKGRNGTLKGNAAWQPGLGRIGGALRVASGGHFAECGEVSLANRSFTVCSWFKRAGAGRWDLFFGQGKEARNEGLQLGFRDSNKFTLAFFGNDLDSRETFTDTEWTHWAGTYDIVSKSRKLYRNGRFLLGGTSRDPYKGRGPFWIGKSVNHDAQGLVDDVRVYSRALAESEIASLFELSVSPLPAAEKPPVPATGASPAAVPGGPVGWWKLDEGSGRTVKDVSGGGRDGKILGAAAWVAETGGTALAFRARGDGVDTGFASDMPRWTVSVWARGDAAPRVAMCGSPVHRERNFQINWDHGDPVFLATAAIGFNNDTWYAAGFGPLDGKRWYHLAATYDGETLVTYKDGVRTGANEEPSGPAAAEAATLKIGRHAVSGDVFTGAVRDVRVYDRALSADEVRKLFEGRP